MTLIQLSPTLISTFKSLSFFESLTYDIATVAEQLNSFISAIVFFTAFSSISDSTQGLNEDSDLTSFE